MFTTEVDLRRDPGTGYAGLRILSSYAGSVVRCQYSSYDDSRVFFCVADDVLDAIITVDAAGPEWLAARAATPADADWDAPGAIELWIGAARRILFVQMTVEILQKFTTNAARAAALHVRTEVRDDIVNFAAKLGLGFELRPLRDV